MMALRYRDDVMDNVWRNFFNEPAAQRFSPVYDVVESDNDYSLSFELPGVEEDRISIEVKDRELTLEVKKEELKKADNDENSSKENYIYRGRVQKAFKKVFKLPEDINSEAVTADLKAGVLTLRIAKKEQVQPKRIAINS